MLLRPWEPGRPWILRSNQALKALAAFKLWVSQLGSWDPRPTRLSRPWDPRPGDATTLFTRDTHNLSAATRRALRCNALRSHDTIQRLCGARKMVRLIKHNLNQPVGSWERSLGGDYSWDTKSCWTHSHSPPCRVAARCRELQLICSIGKPRKWILRSYRIKKSMPASSPAKVCQNSWYEWHRQ